MGHALARDTLQCVSSPPPLRPWPVLESQVGESLRLFQPRWDRVENPRNGHRFEALVLEAPEWANVVARDPEGGYLLVEQWRFGSGAFSLEIPGGVVHRGEEPLAAARRELLEELGGVATGWAALGSVAPNPAIHDNRCHQFLAEGVRLSEPTALDPGEDLRVVRLTESELVQAIREGRVDHALSLTALANLLDLRVTPTALGR